MTENENGQLAAEIIRDWKNDDGTLVNKYGSLGAYAIHREIEAEWQDPNVRAEFSNDREAFVAFKQNEHKVSFHAGMGD